MNATPNLVNQGDEAEVKGNDIRVMSLVGVAHFFSHFYIYLLPPLFPFLKTAFNVSYTELGLLMAVFSGTTGLTQIPLGFLVDRFGAKFILIVGLAVEGIAFSCMGFAPGYPFLVALMFLAGAANGVYHPADYAILSASVSKTRMGRAFSLHTFGGYAGFAVAGPIIILLHSTIGWSSGLLICGIAGIGTALLLMGYSRDLKHSASRSDNACNQKTQNESRGYSGVKLLLSPAILSLCPLNGTSTTGRVEPGIAAVLHINSMFSPILGTKTLNLLERTPPAINCDLNSSIVAMSYSLVSILGISCTIYFFEFYTRPSCNEV